MSKSSTIVDHSALRFNQASIIILLALAFVLNQPWLVVFVAAVNLFLGFCAGCFMYYQLARRGIHANLPWWQAPRSA